MDWSKITGYVANAAPLVGTLLGGPAGAAVGALVANALGVKNDPDSVIEALRADPKALAELQALEINAKVQLQQLAVQAQQLEVQRQQNELAASSADYAASVADRDSARKLAAQQPNDLIRPILACIILLGAVGIIFMIFSGWGQQALGNPTVSLQIGAVIGYWFAALNLCLMFYFGSTKDGAQQSKDLARFAISPTAAANAAYEQKANT